MIVQEFVGLRAWRIRVVIKAAARISRARLISQPTQPSGGVPDRSQTVSGRETLPVAIVTVVGDAIGVSKAAKPINIGR